LAAELRSIRPAENMQWTGTLVITHRGHKIPPVPISCQATVTETNWSVTYLTGATASNGAEKLTVVFSTNAPNEYIYARALAADAPLGAPKTLHGAEADIPLAGSDFWLSDLGFEFYHWPDQVRLKGEMRSSRPCYVLESINPHPAPGGYAKVKTWIEKESGQPLEAEASAPDKSTMKAFDIGSVQKVNGRYQVKNLTMKNTVTKSLTELNFDLETH